MASGWDVASSESDSEPQLDLETADKQLYQHLPKLVDGVTKGAITSSTQLVALYQYQLSSPEIDNRLLHNLTGVTVPSVPCQLIINDGTAERRVLPPSMDAVEDGYQLSLSFNKLLLAPVVHLRCDFLRVVDPGILQCALVHTVVLEWHFNDYLGDGTGISAYEHEDSKPIKFEAGPATCSGFGRLSRYRSKLTPHALEAVSLLKSFLEPGRHAIELKPKASQLSDLERLRLETQLNKLRSRLPGGDGVLLPSIGSVEYAAFGDRPELILCGKDAMRKPFDLLRGAVKHPMVPIACRDTFSTVKEAGVQLGYSAAASDSEAKESLKLWARMYHRGKIFAVGNFAVIGVSFREFEKLGSVNDELHYRLPKDLSTSLSFTDIRFDRRVKVKGVLMGNPVGLPSHDAFFRITSESLDYFGGRQEVEAQSTRSRDYFDVKIDANHISATCGAQLDTINQLQLPKNARWHGVLLNQLHDSLESVDLTRGAVAPDVRRKADDWLLGWLEWNEEQLQVIRGIKVAKGGAVVVMGPAGTGKTLLQQALSIYFYILGFHVLALAPANSNVDHLAVQLGRIKEREVLPSTLKFIRSYPSVRDIVTEKRDDSDEDSWTQSRGFLPFYDLLSGLDEFDLDKGTAREYSLAQEVLQAAHGHTHRLTRRLRTDAGVTLGSAVNAWDLLREFLDKWALGGDDREELLTEKHSKKLEQYRLAYKQCRAHLIGRCRFVLTTTGNVRNQEMLHNWYAEEKEWGMKRIGVIVFVDEAAKDLEANVWGSVVCERWAEGVKGVVLLGDDKQLQPTNTCSRGKVTFNAFNDRLDIPLPCRLVREGFPCYRLLEQRRMNAAISAFPNREIYAGKLRDGAGTNQTLDDKIPGLGRFLRNIIADFGCRDLWERGRIKGQAADDEIRLHWLEIRGERVRHAATKSICVKEHVQVFFKMLPRLQAFFKFAELRLDEHVMIICAYSYALHEYQDRINEMLRRDETLTVEDMPRVLTVDASQGQESFMVLFDGSCQNGDVMGFVDDVGRCNVAITRAKEVFWILGGTMEIKHKHDLVKRPQALLAKYKKELELEGKVHRFSGS